MTPNELVSYVFYEALVVPVAWTGSDLPIGDTPISTLIKVPFTFIVCVFLVAHIIRLVLKPVDFVLHKVFGWEYEPDSEWQDWTGFVAMWGSVIGVAAVWGFYATWFNS